MMFANLKEAASEEKIKAQKEISSIPFILSTCLFDSIRNLQ